MVVLASQSPRRREILENAGIPFVVRVAGVAEERMAGETPEEYVCRLARGKAEAVPAGAGEVVLGADTVVVVDGEVLEKPVNTEDARRMLAALAGRAHEVLTGVCLKSGGETIVDVARTRVWFTGMTAEEIEWYVAGGEPMDKAGAYAIQGGASRFVERIEGCYFNVMGLPVGMVYRHLRAAGLL